MSVKRRKTIVIEFVVEDEENIREKREAVRDLLDPALNPTSPLVRGLKMLGWTGNAGSMSSSVSDPKRTAHWPV